MKLKNLFIYLFVLLSQNLFSIELLQILPSAEIQSVGGLYLNPAMTAFVQKFSFQGTSLVWYENANIYNFVVYLPAREITIFGDYTTTSIEDTYRTVSEETDKKIIFSDNMFVLGISRQVSDKISFGSGIKFVNQQISFPHKSVPDSIITADIGIIFIDPFIKGITGVAVHNFPVSGKSEKPYETISLTGRYKIEKISFHCGVHITGFMEEKYTKVKSNVGLEYNLTKHFKLSTGINFKHLPTLTYGIGINLKTITLNYAGQYNIDLGSTQSFSIRISI